MHILRARTHTQLASTHQNILGKHYANIVYRVSGSRAYAAVQVVEQLAPHCHGCVLRTGYEQQESEKNMHYCYIVGPSLRRESGCPQARFR